MNRPIILICFCFISGILLFSILPIRIPLLFVILAGVYGLIFLLRPTTLAQSYIIYVAFIFLGGLAFKNAITLPANHIYFLSQYYRNVPVSLEGTIISFPQQRRTLKGRKTVFYCRVSAIEAPSRWRRCEGVILVNIFRIVNTPFHYGDKVLLRGKLYKPFDFENSGSFSYKEYLRRRGVFLIMAVGKNGEAFITEKSGFSLMEKLFSLHQIIKNTLAKYLTVNEAGILKAVLLGDRTDIPRHIRRLFVQTGTAHILAISGLHIGIVVFLFYTVARALPIPRGPQYGIVIICLIFYTLLTGLRPSVVRASIIAVIFLISRFLGRSADMKNSLALAAIVLLIWNPLYLFDVGFLLSFSSVIAILIFYPLFQNLIGHGFLPKSHSLSGRIANFFMDALCVSLAAWIGVAGWIAYYFHIITPVTILANLFIIPLMTILVSLGFALIFALSFFPFFAYMASLCIKVILNIMVGVIYVFQMIPGAYFYLPTINKWYVGMYYFIVFLLAISLTRLTKRRKYATVNHEDLSNSP